MGACLVEIALATAALYGAVDWWYRSNQRHGTARGR